MPTIERPWSRPADEVAAELGTDLARGLDPDAVRERQEHHGPNQLASSPPIPAWRRFVVQFADPLIYLLLVAVAISFVAWLVEGAEGVPFEVIVILAILVGNAVLGFVQEAKAERAVAALAAMAAATATVVRAGETVAIPATDLVPGDVVLLAEGDAVPADARLVEVASLTVAEAPLTGESEAVVKGAAPVSADAGIGDRPSMVMSGTAVTRGRARAVVTSIGHDTEMGAVATLLGATTSDPTPLELEIAKIGRTLGLAVVAIAIVVVAAILATSDVDGAAEVVSVLLVGVSLAVAAVPEGLPAVLSVVLAIGVQRMARQNAIVKRLASVETLGSASVICSDKTGTLTRNEMTVVRVVTASGDVELTGSGYDPAGEVRHDGRAFDASDPGAAALLEEVRAVVGGGSLTNDALLREDGGRWTIQGDPTEAAFLVAERKLGIDERRRARFDRIDEVPFSSERKMMTTLQADHDSGGGALVTKGAPDVMLARCDHERVAGEVRPLTDARRAAILATVDELAAASLRTIAVAFRTVPDELVVPGIDESDETGLIHLGMVGIIDPPRTEAADAIADAHAAGIRVVMITGDHPITAARIAGDLGIADEGRPAVTGAELEAMDDGQLREVVDATEVYARVAPADKLRIVDALQARGQVVAMTGDGVNDAPALKSADIGIAMGITGTDVSKEAADMILADDHFATIIAAVRQGRGILSNIRKFLRFLLSSNVGEVLTMFFGVLLAGFLGIDPADGGIAVPLLATQILWINLLTDAAPALAIGVDPPDDDLMDLPPRRLTDRVIDTEMWIGVAFVGAVMAASTLFVLDLHLPGGLVEGDRSLAHARTAAFTTLVLAQLFNSFNARSDRTSAFHHLFTNVWLWGALGLSLVLQVAVVHVGLLNEAFDTVPLPLGDWVGCAAVASVVLWADEARKAISALWRRSERQRG